MKKRCDGGSYEVGMQPAVIRISLLQRHAKSEKDENQRENEREERKN